MSVKCILGRQSTSFNDSTFFTDYASNVREQTVADIVLALWDSASTVSLILNSTGKNFWLYGRPVFVVLETPGSVSKLHTKLY